MAQCVSALLKGSKIDQQLFGVGFPDSTLSHRSRSRMGQCRIPHSDVQSPFGVNWVLCSAMSNNALSNNVDPCNATQNNAMQCQTMQ